MADYVWQMQGICYQKGTDTESDSDEEEVHVVGLKARMSEKNACVEFSVTPEKASAFVGASVGQASADACLFEEIEVGASATICEANASATMGDNGIHAGAVARHARAEAGIKNTPLQAHVEVAGAGVEAGVSLQYSGASAGAHVGEAIAGPIGARIGFTFGGRFRNGIAKVDMGPVTCCVM